MLNAIKFILGAIANYGPLAYVGNWHNGRVLRGNHEN
jgi:hypothetical protein